MAAACMLADSVCSLLPDDSTTLTGITKAHLCQIHKSSFKWPLEENFLLDRLSPLLKNIAKNFIESFYKEKGVALVHHEGLD